VVNQDYAFGVDLSRYNTSPDGKVQVDFDVIATHQPAVSFIAMRAGISWGYQDPWFGRYFAEAGRIGRVRLAYHMLYPGESAQAQMDNFFRILGAADLAHTPLVLDLELDHGYSAARITATTVEACRIIRERTGRTPILYSRAGWVDQYLRVAELPPVHWWLAQYRWPWPYPLATPEHASPPALPRGVSNWLIHQTAARGASIGAKAAHYMDYNRWNGTAEDVAAFVGKEPDTVICPLDQQVCPVHSTI
jgi:GH25 family lysozyme M1 (1,4-beta-N-acetylmuramidase)